MVITINVRVGVGRGQPFEVLGVDALSQSTWLISVYFDGRLNADTLDLSIMGGAKGNGTQIRWQLPSDLGTERFQ